MKNFYEKLVLDAIDRRASEFPIDDDLKQDLACLALNRLSPKYYRFEVDIAFFMEEETRIDMEGRVNQALDQATEYINSRVRVAAS